MVMAAAVSRDEEGGSANASEDDADPAGADGAREGRSREDLEVEVAGAQGGRRVRTEVRRALRWDRRMRAGRRGWRGAAGSRQIGLETTCGDGGPRRGPQL